jgi:membrane protease YdiL (CAAX protease family)
MNLTVSSSWRSPYLLGYVAVYAVLLYLLYTREHFDLGDPLLVLGTIGIGFSFFAWLLTLRATPFPFEVKQPARETALLGVYLLGIAIFLASGMSFVGNHVTNEPAKSLVTLGVKLIVFVMLPFLLFHRLWGYGWRDFFRPSAEWRRHIAPAVGMAVILMLFQVIFGRGLQEVRQAGFPAWKLAVGVPLVFAFLMIEVGLVEEFFFRTLLQSRLSAWLKSEVGGVVTAALLFGLVHAPGLYFRPAATQEGVGAHPSLLTAVGYSVVITSVAGLFLGVLWSRTRNLLLVMVVHAAGDLAPNLAPMIRNLLG